MTALDRSTSNRDANGWRIPRQETIARRVYDYLSEGLSRQAIADRIERKVNYVAVVEWKFKHHEKANAYGTRSRAGRKPKIEE